MGEVASLATASTPFETDHSDLKLAMPSNYSLYHYAEIDSTMDEARRLVESGAAAPSVIWADTQTAGRGRRGREWKSPSGNLYCTVLEPLSGDLIDAGRRSYLYGVAIARAVNSMMPTPNAQVKWPNDVLINRRKLAGVLLETAVCPKTKQLYLIAGFGLNVTETPQGVAYLTTTLAEQDLNVTSKDVLMRILQELRSLDQLLRFEGFAAIRAQWKALACGINERAVVTLPNGAQMEGTFTDLDETGALLLKCSDKLHTITAGDVFFGPANDV